MDPFHAGVVLSTIIAILPLLYGLKNKIGSLGIKGRITMFIKTGLASGTMGVIAYLIYREIYGGR